MFATLVGINISRFLEKKFSKSIINEFGYIGRNSIIYVCLNQLIIIGMTRVVSVLKLSEVIDKRLILTVLTRIFQNRIYVNYEY